jgi:hypothetical protein
MAGTSRFHDKLHRYNHHTVATPGFVDSATDPIASKESPFRGDFILNGSLSSSGQCTSKSATFLSGDIYTNWETGGVMTTNEVGSNTRNGPLTLTLNYNSGVYINGAYGSHAKLVVGAPEALFDQGTISVTNIDAKTLNYQALLQQMQVSLLYVLKIQLVLVPITHSTRCM